MATTPEDLAAQLRRQGIQPTPQANRPGVKQSVADALRAQGLKELANPPPTIGEKISALGTGIGNGLIDSAPVIGGVAGAILTPEMAGAGGIGGVAIGESLRRAYRANVDVPSIDDLPVNLRPYGYAGEVLGGSVVPGMAPLAASGSPIRWIDRIIQTAQRHPIAYGLAEATGAARSAAGVGVADQIAPDNGGARVAGGLAAGISAPVVMGSVGLLKGIAGSIRQWASRAGQQDRAAAEIGSLLAKSGEDHKALIAELSKPDMDGATRTSAQLTGSPALQALEAEMSRRDPDFAAAADKAAGGSLTMIRKMIEKMSTSGDPIALREATEMRRQYFQALITRRMEVAENEARKAASNIAPDASPGARAELGQRTYEIIDGALKSARAVERELWAKIPGHIPSPRTATVAEAHRIATEDLLPEEGLPPLIDAFTRRVAQTPTNARQMLLFRSRMLEEATKAAANHDPATARIYGKMAEAALDDLSSVAYGSGEAREYSRTLNDVFTRSFAGKALEKTGTGAQRIAPEVLMRRATAGPVEMTDMRLQELDRAVRMGKPEAVNEMLGIQQRILALAANDLADPKTGLVTGIRLNRFLRSNELLLNRFPELRALLGSVEGANSYLETVQASTKQAEKAIEQGAAFAKVAGAENPTTAVTKIMNGPAPAQQFGQLARVATTSGEPAVQGLRSAVLGNAYERAGGASGQFSFTSYRSALTEPPKPGGASPMDLMRRFGVMDSDSASRLTRLLDEAAKVEGTVRTRPQLAGMLSDDSALLDLVLRVAGSKVTAASGLAKGPGSLIVASAGSRFARAIFDKIPVGKVQDVLIEASKNPKMMAALLARPASAKARMEHLRMLNAWLVGTGLASVPQPQQEEQPQ